MIIPLFIGLIVAAIVSNSSKPKKALPPSSIPKGVIFTCSYIEITDMKKFRNGISLEIKNYFDENKINTVEQIDLIGLFGYVVKKYNSSCYSKIQSRTLKSTEKIVLGIFISEILKVLEDDLFHAEVNHNDPNYKIYTEKIDSSWPILREWLQIGPEFEQFEGINDAFMKNLKYPIK